MTVNDKPSTVAAIARDWWRGLQGDGSGPDRAALAALRRSDDAFDLAFVDAFAGLRRRLPVGNEWQMERVARIAHVLAHVREDDSRPVARALGPQAGDQPAPMSESRFRRLLQAEEGPDLTRRMIRAVRMLDRRANVADLAAALWWWNDRTRRNWAFQYLTAEPPADAGHPTSDQGPTP